MVLLNTRSMALIKVTRKGQVTIPKKTRETLGVEEGDIVEVKSENGLVLVKPLESLKPHKRVSKRGYEKLIQELDKMREKWR